MIKYQENGNTLFSAFINPSQTEWTPPTKYWKSQILVLGKSGYVI